MKTIIKNKDVDKTCDVYFTYWYRWYVVLVFAAFSMVHGVIWDTWSPISNTVYCAYGLTSKDIYLLANWPSLLVLPILPIFSWFVDTKGLRITVIIGISVTTVGAALRCLPLNNSVLKYFIHSGHILNGLSTAPALIVPSLLSVTWFPPNERITATSIGSLASDFGPAIYMIVAPNVVSSPPLNVTNNFTCNIDEETKIKMKRQTEVSLYVQVVISVVILVFILGFFPDKPPSPPSKSSGLSRRDFIKGILELRMNRQFLVSNFSLAAVIGVYTAWISVLDVLFTPYGVSQVTAGNLAFVMMVAGCILGLFLGWLADRWQGHTRMFILVLLAIGALGTLYLNIMLNHWIPVRLFLFSEVGLWISSCAIGITNGALMGVGYEMVAESAYPTAEGTAISILLWFICLFITGTLLILPESGGEELANFILLGTYIITLLSMLFFTSEPVSRIEIDQTPKKQNDKTPLISTFPLKTY